MLKTFPWFLCSSANSKTNLPPVFHRFTPTAFITTRVSFISAELWWKTGRIRGRASPICIVLGPIKLKKIIGSARMWPAPMLLFFQCNTISASCGISKFSRPNRQSPKLHLVHFLLEHWVQPSVRDCFWELKILTRFFNPIAFAQNVLSRICRKSKLYRSHFHIDFIERWKAASWF